MKNVHPVYGAGIRTLEHESPPTTTRSGLPPNKYIVSLWLLRPCAHLLTLSRYFIACGKSYKWNLFALDDSTSSTFENLHSHIYSLACLRTGHGKLDECIHLLFLCILPSFESFVLDLRNTFQNLISLGRTGMEKV